MKIQVDERVMWREAALLAFAALVQIGGTVLASRGQDEHGTPPLLGIGLLALGVAAIPWRLKYPVAALAVAFGATLAYASLDYAKGPIFVSLIITFGNVILAGHRRVAIATMVAGFVGFNWLGPAFDRGDAPSVAVAFALAAWLLVLFTGFELIRDAPRPGTQNRRRRRPTRSSVRSPTSGWPSPASCTTSSPTTCR